MRCRCTFLIEHHQLPWQHHQYLNDDVRCEVYAIEPHKLITAITSSIALLTHSQYCLICIPYTSHTTNDSVRRITACSPVSGWVKLLRLRFFGHLARTAPEEDHHRVIAAALRPPAGWMRPVGRYLADDNRWWPSVFELWGPHGLEEGKR